MGIKTQDSTLGSSSTTSYPFENNNKLKRQPAIDENLMAREQQNLLNASGQTSTQSDPRQIEKAISMLVANSNLYTTSGTANAIILTTKTINSANANSIQMSNLHFDEDGVKYEFVASFTNTGAITVAITGFLTAQNIVDINGTVLTAGSIVSGRRYTLIRDKVNNRFGLEQSFILSKQITLSSGDATTINYTAGTFDADDRSGRYSLAAGSANITTFYPTPANNTPYYVFVVANPITKATTVIIDNNKASPTLPTGFTVKSYLGALMTNGVGQIRTGTYLFQPNGIYHFTYDDSVEDTYHQNDSGAFQNYTITIPAITGLAYVQGKVVNDVPSAYPFIYLYAKNKPNSIIVRIPSSDAGEAASQGYIPVTGDRQIAKSWGGEGARRVWQYTLGWVDYLI